MFRKHHKKYPVRTENQIQEEIIQTLREFPKSTYGVAKAINCDKRTARRNLEKLAELNRIKVYKQPFKLSFVRYWAINSEYD